MSLIYQASPLTALKKRSSARLDLLTTMASLLDQPESLANSPHDSLSPLDGSGKFDFVERKKMGSLVRQFSFEDSASEEEAVFQTKPKQQEPHLTCQKSQTKHEVATTERPFIEACTPRSTLIIRDRRPSDLALTKTNGLTTISLAELKQCICDAGTVSYATILQVPRPKANHLPKTPDTPSPFFFVMGNRPSSLAGSPVPPPDNASLNSVVRKQNRVLRKSSTNLLKRVQSQTPLHPAKLTGTVIHVQQQHDVSPVSSEDLKYDSDESVPVPVPIPEVEPRQFSEQWQDVSHTHSPSTATITNENALRSLEVSESSGSESQAEVKVEDRNPYRQTRSNSQPSQQPLAPRNLLPLSPSIPAPSPLPEDSPHKYGLKDRSDTPDMPEPEEINVAKARRRSSGLDIFNEAKSLQSASSFLNGLSTSRRRAESSSHLTNSNTEAQDPNRPSYSRPQSRPAPPQSTYSSERLRGHNFKPSGFAYSRPLKMAQIKCFRDHERLLPSRNRKEKAPVECAVCHVDDEKEHFSCSWCAIRMCRFCRSDFVERGMVALRERVRLAEMGCESDDCGMDGVGAARDGLKSYA